MDLRLEKRSGIWQFFVSPCNNDPPIIEAITDTCIQAGEELNLDFQVWDPNDGDSLYFQLNNDNLGFNGPFDTTLSPFADIDMTVIGLPPFDDVPVEVTDTIFGTIEWETNCSHIRKSFYQIDLYAHDNINYDPMLSAHHVITVTVTPPKVTGLSLTTGPRSVTLNWDEFTCPNALGYHVYWNPNGSGSSLDTICCGTGILPVPGTKGLESILGIENTSYFHDLKDLDVSYEQDICYLVVAFFDGNQLSCPSEEECISLNLNDFVVTNADVDVTDVAAGEIFVAWSRPNLADIDGVFFPGPYTYNLYRANGIKGLTFTKINTSPIGIDDTTFTDTGIDTETRGYKYYIELEDDIGPVMESNRASSIYLENYRG